MTIYAYVGVACLAMAVFILVARGAQFIRLRWDLTLAIAAMLGLLAFVCFDAVMQMARSI